MTPGTAPSTGTAATGTAPSGIAPSGTAPGTGRSADAGAPGPGQQPAGTSTTPGRATDSGAGTSTESRAETGAARQGPAVAQERGGGRGPARVAITTPSSGHTLSADDPPIVVVRGRVDDPEIATIWLSANSRRIQVPVKDGKFEYPVVVIDRTTTISAEANSSAVRKSESITVHAAPDALATGVVILDWGIAKPAGAIEMSGTWRARSDRLDGQQGKLAVRNAPLPDEIPMTAFYVRNMQSGVFTFVLGYRGMDAASRVQPKFYLTTPGAPTVRELKPITLSGTGKAVTVRFLLPQGVMWEQDEWFAGRSEASDTITKFRDDGTSWIERR